MTQLVGSAGEHYVMFELLRRGFIAALAPEGVPMIDILISNATGDRQHAIQGKTRSGRTSNKGWPLGKKNEDHRSETLLYVFVDLASNMNQLPTCYIVPSAVVADAITESHSTWLAEPGRNGQPRNDSPMRQFLTDYGSQNIGRPAGWLNQYQDSWNLLVTT